MAGLLLLLSSLAAQTAVHQSRLRHGASLQQRRAEDRLVSAAHHLVGRVAAGHGCLLALALEQWSEAPEGCADAVAREGLRNGSGAPLPYRLIQWRPLLPAAAAGSAGSLELLLEEPGAAPWRAAFLLDLQVEPGAGPPRVTALRELGLRGMQP